jgi:hypothetical protein
LVIKVFGGGKKIRFRAMVSTSGKNRMQIVIPKFYHQDFVKKELVGKVVFVEVSEMTESIEES